MLACATGGCSGGFGSGADREAERTYSADEVQSNFARLTGDRLNVVNRFETRPGVSGFDTLEPVGRLNDRYGSFEVDVFYDIDKTMAQGGYGIDPDADGIYWTKHVPESPSEERSWSATKLYANVQLTWRTKVKRVDERWRRLDRVFASMTARN